MLAGRGFQRVSPWLSRKKRTCAIYFFEGNGNAVFAGLGLAGEG